MVEKTLLTSSSLDTRLFRTQQSSVFSQRKSLVPRLEEVVVSSQPFFGCAVRKESGTETIPPPARGISASFYLFKRRQPRAQFAQPVRCV